MNVRRSTKTFICSAAGISLFALLMGFAVPAMAQTDRGIITGTITDPAGAVVPGATVIATNKANGASVQSVTTSTGNYTLPSLASGVYDLTIEAAGFSKYI